MREKIKFELRRLTEYTDEAILGEIRRIASLFPDTKFTQVFFSKHSRVNRSTILRRFGSWEKALSAAKLEHRLTGNPLLRLSDEKILQVVRELATNLGKPNLTIRDVQAHLGFDAFNLFTKRWGSVRAAFEAAGLSQSPLGRRYSDEECFDNMLSVWTHYGRPPMYREMGRPPSQVGGKAYVKRFGSWTKALAAFVERVNSSEEETQESKNLSDDILSQENLGIGQRVVRQTVRDIPLGLRFKVLRRDLFKCVLCGDNPPRNANCILHVDHIRPWSKGGTTVETNLRTLCANCNVGRGNRYDD